MYRYDRFCQSLSLCTVLVSMHACVVCLLSVCVRARLVRCVRAVFFAVSSVCVLYLYINYHIAGRSLFFLCPGAAAGPGERGCAETLSTLLFDSPSPVSGSAVYTYKSRG